MNKMSLATLNETMPVPEDHLSLDSLPDPFARAALRQRFAVQPDGGRQAGMATGMLNSLLPTMVWETLQIPQRSFESSERLRLTGEYDPAPFVDAALLSMGGPALQIARPPRTRIFESRSNYLQDTPAGKRRRFNEDYRGNAPADAFGNLTRDIDGRLLDAETVVGRRVVDGADEAFPLKKYDPFAEATTGARAKTVSPREMGQNVGETRVVDGKPVEIRLRNDLSPRDAQRAYAHELGHVIDQIVGEIPTQGLTTELHRLYHAMGTGKEGTRKLLHPQQFGYTDKEIPRELVAEAIRAYMADPNYIKLVAPKTAAAIRAAVNPHSVVSRYIQFNSLAPIAGGGTLAGSVAAPLSGENAQSGAETPQ